MKYTAIFLFIVFTVSCTAQKVNVPGTIKEAMKKIDTNQFRAHIAFLADDKLKGRMPGTAGYQVAVDYVTDQFKTIGVKPAGDGNSYLQKLLIRKAVVNKSSAVVVLKDENGNVDSLVFGQHYAPMAHPLQASTAAEGELVFAGYGLELPAVYSDYEGIDVKGKIVVLIAGAPSGFPSTITAHFSNVASKMDIAYARGAIGVVLINPALKSMPSSSPQMSVNVALDPGKTTAYSSRLSGKIIGAITGSRSLLEKLFFKSGKSLEQALADIRNRKPSSFNLQQRIAISYTTTHSDFESYNVVGVIPGSDEKLKDEYVIHSAHLDHMGIGKPVNGDSIYNGAHDNASGVASLLEIARIYTTSGAKPKRSILFVMLTAEEMGLVGSGYFAANPIVPKQAIVANVNTDMPTLIAPLLSVVPLGAEHSTIMEHVQFAAKQLKLDVENDPEPEQNRFVRSDQYSFVKQGIPSLHVKYGNKTNDTNFDLVKYVQDWREKYYHKPADELNGTFDFDAAKTYVRFNFLVSYSIAQSIQRPQWNAGDLFGITTSKK